LVATTIVRASHAGIAQSGGTHRTIRSASATSSSRRRRDAASSGSSVDHELLDDRVARRATDRSGHRTLATEQGVEQRALARIRRPDQGDQWQVATPRRPRRPRREFVPQPAFDIVERRRQPLGRHGDHVLLVGEVDAGLDGGQDVGKPIGPFPRRGAEPAAGDLAGRRNFLGIRGRNRDRDRLGLEQVDPTRGQGPRRELARPGPTYAGMGMERRHDGIEQRRMARQRQLDRVLAGERRRSPRHHRNHRHLAERGPHRAPERPGPPVDRRARPRRRHRIGPRHPHHASRSGRRGRRRRDDRAADPDHGRSRSL
jgi:hypothetical protein